MTMNLRKSSSSLSSSPASHTAASTRSRVVLASLLALAAAAFSGACGSNGNYIAGTEIPRSDDNRSVINRVEEYRSALEEKDAAGLLLMASREYWEDSGTPTGEDDYGFAGLKEVLSTRFKLADSIRYSMRYKRVRYQNNTASGKRQAFVDVLVDASFTIPDARGGFRRNDKRDQAQFVLEWDNDKWMFLSGM